MGIFVFADVEHGHVLAYWAFLGIVEHGGSPSHSFLLGILLPHPCFGDEGLHDPSFSSS